MTAKRFGREFKASVEVVQGCSVLTVAPAVQRQFPSRHVLFLHGGAYVLEAMAPHRALVKRLVRDHDLTITCVDYPLAPEHTCERTLAAVRAIYGLIAARTGGGVALLGDSAGGGLALSLLQSLRTEGAAAMPPRSVLMSPWLDLLLEAPDTVAMQAVDPMLDLDALRRAGKAWAGTAPAGHPALQPLEGRMDGLGDILLLAGSHELFLPDCERLRDRLAAAVGSRVCFIRGDGMLHDWIVMPVPEARRTIGDIGRFLSPERSTTDIAFGIR